MSDSNQLRDSNPVPPDVTAGSSVQPPRKFSRFLKKAKDGVAKKFSGQAEIIKKRSNMKNLRSHEPEVQDALSVVKQTADPKSALQHAKEAVKGIKPLSKRVQSAVSTTQNAPAGLEDAYTLQDTYLKPLKIFDNVIGTLADVHPYAKIALGALSCASKMVIAQADRDQAVHHLVDKLDQVYNFMIQDETLRQISSMRGIVGQISQQTLEYARFIRDYSETKNFFFYCNREETRERHSHRNKQ
ncbi:uncharacterized protein EDB93DRAFT_1107121 [Suillus bovinus]|uniref:uncharacterized protein n=1 Tax=Suillus bovinus TaxID=48563 RepID=UPI001B8670BF|nr:uncharacterized protein EDB93DRAFT_1107121 [Suillus bovinus]KAG2135365.1 hypothetical protein EDB93DRAFT_1107121 [Suillus bovinus]